MIQIATFHENTSSLQINDEIRRTPGAFLVKVRFSKGDKVRSKISRFDEDVGPVRRLNPGTKIYIIANGPVEFKGVRPLRDKRLKV